MNLTEMLIWIICSFLMFAKDLKQMQVNELEIDLRKQTDLLYNQTWQNDI